MVSTEQVRLTKKAKLLLKAAKLKKSETYSDVIERTFEAKQ